MSLTGWFRDYLYIPLGGSRRGVVRKYVNVMLVFAVSGLWHGAAMTFVVWGLLNGLYQMAGAVTKPLRERVGRAVGLGEETGLRALLQIAVTFVLTTAAWVFFKADTLSGALAVFRGMVSGPLWAYRSMSLDRWELLAAAVGLLVLFAVDLSSLRFDLPGKWLSAPRGVRWVVLWGLLFACLIFGCWGAGYDAQSFLYGFSF